MKKVLVIIGILFAFGAKAQVATMTWSGYGNTLDTVTNTATRYSDITVTKPAYGLSVVLKVLKISGTVAGTISWQGSNNGTDYATISTASASDASANYTFSVLGNPNYKYYRVTWTGSGTMSASIAGSRNIVR